MGEGRLLQKRDLNLKYLIWKILIGVNWVIGLLIFFFLILNFFIVYNLATLEMFFDSATDARCMS